MIPVYIQRPCAFLLLKLLQMIPLYIRDLRYAAKSVTDRRTDGRTDRQDHPIRPFWSKTCLTAAWDQKGQPKWLHDFTYDYTYAYIHTCIHAYIHTYDFTFPSASSLSVLDLQTLLSVPIFHIWCFTLVQILRDYKAMNIFLYSGF